MVAVPAPDDVRRVLDDDGKPLPGAKLPAIADATLARMLDIMLLVRVLDDRMMQLVREGRLGFYLASNHDEASQLAIASLRDTDWVFPSAREQAAWLWRGYTIEQYVDQLFGNSGDLAKGRQVPVHHSARALRMVSISAPVGTQIPQAVGAAYAAHVLERDDVALTFFGEGSAASGEFHVGLNFAGVWKAPCIFFCRNTSARALAKRAIGYGMPGVRVDGCDPLAVWQATTDAAERARAGLGPTLIDAVISADADPLRRLRGYLRGRGLSSEAGEREQTERHERAIASALAAAETKRPPAVATMFDDVYEQLPWHLREQLASLQER